MRSSWLTPSPVLSMHTTDVDEAHAEVTQLVSPIVDVGVVPLTAKFIPDTVTLQPAVTAALASATKLATGATGCAVP